MKLITVKFSPFSCCFLSLGFTHSTHHLVLISNTLCQCSALGMRDQIAHTYNRSKNTVLCILFNLFRLLDEAIILY
jgi:hypothetical protein